MAEAIEHDDGKPGKKTSVGSRERRLRALEHWDEIDIRLRCRHSPERILAWHQRAYPTAQLPSIRTLYRYLADQAETWFVPSLLLEETVRARMPHLLVAEEHAELVLTQKLRLRNGLRLEQGDGTAERPGMGGLLYQEVTRNVELTGRLLVDHDRIINPKASPAGKDEDDPDARSGAHVREMHDLVHRIVDLPVGEFMPTVIALIGPPPVKQPLVLEGEGFAVDERSTREARDADLAG